MTSPYIVRRLTGLFAIVVAHLSTVPPVVAESVPANVQTAIKLISDFCLRPSDKVTDLKIEGDVSGGVSVTRILKGGLIDAEGKFVFRSVDGQQLGAAANEELAEVAASDRAAARTCMEKHIERILDVLLGGATGSGSSQPTSGHIERIGAGISLTLLSCSKNADSVECNFLAKALDGDARIRIDDSTLIVDQMGSVYSSSYGSVANASGTLARRDIVANLVRGVETPASIRFSGVSESTTKLAKTQVVMYVKMQRNTSRNDFEYRDVEFVHR